MDNAKQLCDEILELARTGPAAASSDPEALYAEPKYREFIALATPEVLEECIERLRHGEWLFTRAVMELLGLRVDRLPPESLDSPDDMAAAVVALWDASIPIIMNVSGAASGESSETVGLGASRDAMAAPDGGMTESRRIGKCLQAPQHVLHGA